MASDTLTGVLAVAGLVMAFSLSSTLVKLADSPGVLVAFWRMALVSVVWNGYLWSRGRRVRLTDLRRALVPGLFLGCNLVAFFVGATHNSVANAALLGSLSPLLIVPLGAALFAEWHRRGALVALGGVVLVLRSAPAGGDASTLGNVLGGTATLLWPVGELEDVWRRAEGAHRGQLDVDEVEAALRARQLGQVADDRLLTAAVVPEDVPQDDDVEAARVQVSRVGGAQHGAGLLEPARGDELQRCRDGAGVGVDDQTSRADDLGHRQQGGSRSTADVGEARTGHDAGGCPRPRRTRHPPGRAAAQGRSADSTTGARWTA